MARIRREISLKAGEADEEELAACFVSSCSWTERAIQRRATDPGRSARHTGRRDAPTVDTDPEKNANAIVLKGKDLDALSDDPDELQNELQALAGPSAGPNGGQLYVDGFSGGQIPPKSSIREIRINQNPFSAQFDRLGYGRIEIFTKPGTAKAHGEIESRGNASILNSQNPILNANLKPGEPAIQEPSYYSYNLTGSIGGPIGKSSSYFLSLFARNNQNEAIVDATNQQIPRRR